jgi:hypothetical protein
LHPDSLSDGGNLVFLATVRHKKGQLVYVGVIMKISATAETTFWSLTREELFEPEERLGDAVRIAQAIGQLMDPEWRELVDQEQREKRRIASLGLSNAEPLLQSRAQSRDGRVG